MNPYSKLAKQAIEQYLKDNSSFKLKGNLPDELKQKAGVFVSLKINNQLRGCLGTYLPTKKNIAQEIIKNAILAGFNDPRFPIITKKELKQLQISIDILKTPTRIYSTDELDPLKYGVIVKTTDQSKIGLLLPNLEGVTTSEEQISIACEKAKIDLKKEKIIIYKFKVTRYDN